MGSSGYQGKGSRSWWWRDSSKGIVDGLGDELSVEGVGHDVGERRRRRVMRRIDEVIRSLVGSNAMTGVASEAMVMMVMVVVVMMRSGLGSGHFGFIAVIRNSEAVAGGQHVCERSTRSTEIRMLKINLICFFSQYNFLGYFGKTSRPVNDEVPRLLQILPSLNTEVQKVIDATYYVIP